MGRKKFQDDTKELLYREMYLVLKDRNRRSDNLKAFGKTEDQCITESEKRELEGYMLADELLDAINENQPIPFTKSNMSAALQHGRRQLDKKRLKVTQWIMASPKGLFLPKSENDKRICAYVVQNFKDINSRNTTQVPLFAEVLRINPDGLREAFHEANKEWEVSNEMKPWAVWSSIMDDAYASYTALEPNYRDDDYWR